MQFCELKLSYSKCKSVNTFANVLNQMTDSCWFVIDYLNVQSLDHVMLVNDQWQVTMFTHTKTISTSGSSQRDLCCHGTRSSTHRKGICRMLFGQSHSNSLCWSFPKTQDENTPLQFVVCILQTWPYIIRMGLMKSHGQGLSFIARLSKKNLAQKCVTEKV